MHIDDFLFSWPFFIALFVLGTCIGSFLNVVIYRMPRDMSVSKPSRSFCTTSGKTIPWYDNIPVLSYLALRGKSRYDGKPISIRYPLVEIITGLLFVLIWVTNQGQWINAGLYIILTSFMIAGSAIDFEHFIIPDEITKTTIVLGVIFSAIWPGLHGTADYGESFLWGIWGAIFGYGLLWGVGYLGSKAFKKEAMGMGDMKLMGGFGAFLGAQSVVFTLITASFIGAAVGLTLIAIKKRNLSMRIPFGPYLSLGALIWMSGGDKIWDWYLSTLKAPQEEVVTLVLGVIFG